MNVHYSQDGVLLLQLTIFMSYPHVPHSKNRRQSIPKQFPKDEARPFPFFSHLINYVINQMNDTDVILSITWNTVYFVFKKETA